MNRPLPTSSTFPGPGVRNARTNVFTTDAGPLAGGGPGRPSRWRSAPERPRAASRTQWPGSWGVDQVAVHVLGREPLGKGVTEPAVAIGQSAEVDLRQRPGHGDVRGRESGSALLRAARRIGRRRATGGRDQSQHRNHRHQMTPHLTPDLVGTATRPTHRAGHRFPGAGGSCRRPRTKSQGPKVTRRGSAGRSGSTGRSGSAGRAGQGPGSGSAGRRLSAARRGQRRRWWRARVPSRSGRSRSGRSRSARSTSAGSSSARWASSAAARWS